MLRNYKSFLLFIMFFSLFIVNVTPTSIHASATNNPWALADRTQAPSFKKRVRKFLKNKVDVKVYQELSKLFDSVECEFPLDLIKAIAWQESRWQQFNPNGTVTKGINYRKNKRGKMYIHSTDYGIMQINDKTSSLNTTYWDFERIKKDPFYNIEAGIEVLRHKVAYAKALQKRSDWNKFAVNYNLTNCSTMEIAIKAYNGMRYSNEYIDAVNHARRMKPWERSGSLYGRTKSKSRPQLPKASVQDIKQGNKIKRKTSTTIIKKPVFVGDPVME